MIESMLKDADGAADKDFRNAERELGKACKALGKAMEAVRKSEERQSSLHNNHQGFILNLGHTMTPRFVPERGVAM